MNTADLLKAGQVEVPWTGRLMSLFGLVALMLIAWSMSTNRRKIHWRVVLWGCALQITLGLLVLRTDAGASFFGGMKDGVNKMLEFYKTGADLVLGGIVTNRPFVFILEVLPTIIFFSSLMAVLYHLRIMQALVGGVAWLMRRTMRTSGAESLSAAGNIFVGQTEAPLLIRPFVAGATKSELMSVMTGGFATVAGGVFVAYVFLLRDVFPDIAGHLMTASIMSAPAALLVAKLMYPEEEQPATAEANAVSADTPYVNVIDAATTGAADGLKLALNVAAMLLAFVALVAMVNFLFGAAGAGLDHVFGWFGFETTLANLTMQKLLGWILAPLAWLMGVPWSDCVAVGQLLGTKTVLNEWLAYDSLAKMLQAGTITEARSVVIATYALCGFANFGSIAIQVGGISAIAPSRRQDLARIGLRAMVGGTLAAFMTATVAGMLL